MGAIMNGIAAHGGLIPFGATFLVFSDYMRPPMRLAALMQKHVIYVFTHDSIGVGEDGPTHQPVEQLLALRSIPNLTLIRPADANETAAAWRIAIEHRNGPVALVFTRQKLPILDTVLYPQIHLGVKSGGYVLADVPGEEDPEIILIATGSEVHLAMQAREQLLEKEVRTRVVSLPCWQLFQAQPQEYRDEVLPSDVPKLVIEAGVSLGWRPYVGPHMQVIGVDKFGESAPGPRVMEEYGFSVENVTKKALELLGRG